MNSLQTNNPEEYKVYSRWDEEPGEELQDDFAVPILITIWQAFLRWKWMVLGIVSATLILTLIYTLLTTPQYTAHSTIQISRDQKRITNVESVESENTGRDLEFYQTQYSLLEARSLAERVARRLNLSSNPRFYEAHGLDNSAEKNERQVSTAKERQKTLKLVTNVLLANIEISPIPRSSLIEIKYTSASPQMSEQISNAWAQQFIEAGIDRKFASTSDARDFLENRLQELRTRLEESERELVRYAREKGIVSLNNTSSADGVTQNGATLVGSDLKSLSDALSEATAERLAAESKWAAFGSRADNSDTITNVAISGLRQRRAELEAEYARLMVQFEPGYPQAMALSEQIRALGAGIRSEEKRVKAGTATDYQKAKQEEERLRSYVDRLKNQFSAEQQNSIQYNIYQREVDTSRELYNALLQRYKEIGVAGVAANNVAIVDQAEIPTHPSSPNLPLNMAVGLFLGLFLAGGSVFALEQIDEGLRDISSVGKIFNLPLLGVIPKFGENLDAYEELRDQKSHFSEAYLTVRSNLAFSTDHGVPKSLMTTSTTQAEGKSTTSIALSMVLARTGKKVLLIDADMRSPSIDSLFGIKNKAGLSNYLAGDENWLKNVQQSAVVGLVILTTGPKPPNAAELLSSDRIKMLVDDALNHFDHVIVDSPPLLGLADAPLIAQSVEAVVYVMQAAGTPIRAIKEGVNRLRNSHATIQGAIVTKFDNTKFGRAYGYGYGYGYGTDVVVDD